MASVALILKKNKINSKGELPLYIRIIQARRTKYISLGVWVELQHWDSSKLRVKSGHKNSGYVNAFIAKKVADTEESLLHTLFHNNQMTTSVLKEAIYGKIPVSFIDYMQKDINGLFERGKIGTYDKYKSTLCKLKGYLKGKDLSFHEFDLKFLMLFEEYLRNKLSNSTNTIHGTLKIFRKIFNDAIREEIISCTPFSKHKLHWEKTSKEYLTSEELKLIEDLKLKPDTMMFHHRNMYVFACYSAGIRISDLLKLKWKDFTGTHINVFLQKTKEHLSIKLPIKAIEIIQYYKQYDSVLDNYIFPGFDNCVDCNNPKEYFKSKSRATAYANKNLKDIARLSGLSKEISFHTSRHTFATLALTKGIRIELVSKLMGHSSIKTTQIYAKIINPELDNAMHNFDN